MSSPAARAVAKKVANKAKAEAMRARNLHRGEVISVKPLRIDLHYLDMVLDDDDLSLSQWVTYYHRKWKIKKGDTAVVMREGGDWTVTDIESDTEMDDDA